MQPIEGRTDDALDQLSARQSGRPFNVSSHKEKRLWVRYNNTLYQTTILTKSHRSKGNVMNCYDQGAVEVSATNFTQSLHYTFGPASLIVTISLSSRVDFTNLARAQGSFTRVRHLSGPDEPLPNPIGLREGHPAQIRDNDLTEIWGFLDAFGCRAKAVVNFFAWSQL